MCVLAQVRVSHGSLNVCLKNFLSVTVIFISQVFKWLKCQIELSLTYSSMFLVIDVARVPLLCVLALLVQWSENLTWKKRRLINIYRPQQNDQIATLRTGVVFLWPIQTGELNKKSSQSPFLLS